MRDHSKDSVAEALGYTQLEWDVKVKEVNGIWVMGLNNKTRMSQLICNVLDDMTIPDEVKIYGSFVTGYNGPRPPIVIIPGG